MVDNKDINLSINISESSEISGSSIGNIAIYTTLSSSEILSRAYEGVFCEINEIDDINTKRTLLMNLNNIKDYFSNNLTDLETIVEQVNCKIRKTQEKNIFTITKLLSFLVVASYTNENLTIPSKKNSKINIKESANWFFNAAEFNEISLAKHISKITDYIYSTQDCSIKDGICHIAMLLSYKDINYCSNCEKGLLKDNNANILPEIINPKDEWQKDFFDLRANRKLKFKCGKCTSNISQYKFAKEILEDI